MGPPGASRAGPLGALIKAAHARQADPAQQAAGFLAAPLPHLLAHRVLAALRAHAISFADSRPATRSPGSAWDALRSYQPGARQPNGPEDQDFWP
jgi:hypothetical protein